MNPYMHPFAQSFVAGLGPLFIVILLVVIVWSFIWKGLALWHSARNHQTAWFVVLLILNTLGILEIIYLLFFRKNKNKNVSTTTVVHTTTTVPPVIPPTSDSSVPPAV